MTLKTLTICVWFKLPVAFTRIGSLCSVTWDFELLGSGCQVWVEGAFLQNMFCFASKTCFKGQNIFSILTVWFLNWDRNRANSKFCLTETGVPVRAYGSSRYISPHQSPRRDRQAPHANEILSSPLFPCIYGFLKFLNF